MFQGLSDRLNQIFKQLRGYGRLSEENIAESLRELRLALLEADVNFKVVKELLDRVRIRALGEEVRASISPAQEVVRIVRDELVELLGNKEALLTF